jgi:hypothetical protein
MAVVFSRLLRICLFGSILPKYRDPHFRVIRGFTPIWSYAGFVPLLSLRARTLTPRNFFGYRKTAKINAIQMKSFSSERKFPTGTTYRGDTA